MIKKNFSVQLGVLSFIKHFSLVFRDTKFITNLKINVVFYVLNKFRLHIGSGRLVFRSLI